MSFYKITNKKEREDKFNQLIQLQNNLKEKYLAESLGQTEFEMSKNKLFKPIIQSNVESSQQIVKKLEDLIKPSMLNQSFDPNEPIQAQLPQIQHIEASASYHNLGSKAAKYLGVRAENRLLADIAFGLGYDTEQGLFTMGNASVVINGDDLQFLFPSNGRMSYKGTDGLWQLLTLNEPNNYTDKDLKEYKEILIKSEVMYLKNNRKQNRPKANRGHKWVNIVKPIWEEMMAESPVRRTISETSPRYGKGCKIAKKSKLCSKTTNTIILPSDPNALVEKLVLNISSKQAGNTGVDDETFAILDQLKRMNVITSDDYRKFVSTRISNKN
jgi:hypothetical protein